MNRTALLIVGLLGFGLWAALWCVPTHVVAIESDILTRAMTALDGAGLRAQAVVDGQIVTLTGAVASADARALAEDTVARVRGVTRIVNELTVAADSRVADSAPVRFEASLLPAEVTLSGHVADDTQRASVVGHARIVFAPKQVIDRLSLRADVPANYGAALTLGIEQLARLRNGRFSLNGNVAELRGEAPDPTVRDSIVGAFELAALAPLRVSTFLHMAPPTMARRDECQSQLDRLLRGRVVRFATSSAKISADSFPLLDSLAGAAKACADVGIEVQGHTDDRGDAAANLALSERRATAVVEYLLREGVDARQLRARGYGETVPRQTNATAAGRAANRRIELKALMPNEESDS